MMPCLDAKRPDDGESIAGHHRWIWSVFAAMQSNGSRQNLEKHDREGVGMVNTVPRLIVFKQAENQKSF
jgi:hypothetical protein